LPLLMPRFVKRTSLAQVAFTGCTAAFVPQGVLSFVRPVKTLSAFRVSHDRFLAVSPACPSQPAQ
jgi:hypothetical protein